MTNVQLPGARRAQRLYPDASIDPAEGGATVNGVFVAIPDAMTAEDVFRALAQQVIDGAQGS